MATKPAADLDAMTVEELTALIASAETKKQAKLADAKSALLAEMEEKAAALGMSVQDLFGRSGGVTPPAGRKLRADAGKPVAAKYRSPQGETWTGRGRRPGWLTDAIAKGKGVDDFRI